MKLLVLFKQSGAILFTLTEIIIVSLAAFVFVSVAESTHTSICFAEREMRIGENQMIFHSEPSQWGDHQRTSLSSETTIHNSWPLCSLKYAVLPSQDSSCCKCPLMQSAQEPTMAFIHCMYDLHEQTCGPPLFKLQQALSFPTAGPVTQLSTFC